MNAPRRLDGESQETQTRAIQEQKARSRERAAASPVADREAATSPRETTKVTGRPMTLLRTTVLLLLFLALQANVSTASYVQG